MKFSFPSLKLGSVLGRFFNYQVQEVKLRPDWHVPQRDVRVNDPSLSFLGRKSHWWVFDYDGRVSKIIPENQGINADVYTDRHFVMFQNNSGKGNPFKVFRRQVDEETIQRPAKLKGKVYLIPTEVIKELDEAYNNQIDCVRTRTRVMFADYVKDFPKTVFDRPEPTIFPAWMWFDRTTPKLLREFAFDRDHYAKGNRIYEPVPVVRHNREYINNYYETGEYLPNKTEGYIKLEIHKGSRKMPQVS